MAQTPAITITGASGRMGQMLLQTVLNSDKARLVGAVERKGHPWIGNDAANLALVPRQCHNSLLVELTAQRHDVYGRNLQIWRGGHLLDSD